MPYEHAPKPDALEGVTLFEGPIPGDRYEVPEEEQEATLLSASLEALQYMRWAKWEPYYREHEFWPFDEQEVQEMQDLCEAMSYENYEVALNSLVNRFGEDFFEEVAWERMSNHLMGLHCKENNPPSPYKAHADVNSNTWDIPWLDAVKTITAGEHPLPDQTQHYGINVMALYGDVDFWKFTRNNYPEMFTSLVQKYLALPENLWIDASHDHLPSTVHPRALLKEHFPETYDFLLSEEPAFAAPIGAIAVKPVLGKFFGLDNRPGEL